LSELEADHGEECRILLGRDESPVADKPSRWRSVTLVVGDRMSTARDPSRRSPPWVKVVAYKWRSMQELRAPPQHVALPVA